MKTKQNPMWAVLTLGRDLMRSAAQAVADNPPSISAILLSATLAFFLARIHGRSEWMQALKPD